MISSLFENSKSPFKRIYKTRRQTKTHLFSFQDRPQTGPMPASNERKSRLFSKDKTSAFSLKQQKQNSSNANNSSNHGMSSSGHMAGTGSSGSSMLDRNPVGSGNRIASSSMANQQATDMAHVSFVLSNL